MFATIPPACRRVAIRLGAVVGIVALAGCAELKDANIPPSMSRNLPPLQRSDSGSTLRLAHAARQAGDINSAVQIYRNLIASGSTSGPMLVEFGDTLVEAGLADDAIDIYSRVETRSSERFVALIGMTRAYLSLGDAPHALVSATEAQGLKPQDPRVLVNRGVALDTLGRHVEAQESYRTVLVGTPRHVSARNNLALSLALTGQFAEAVELMGPLLRSSAATPRMRENMAVIYGLMGEPERAAALTRIGLSEEQTQSNLHFLATVRAAGS